MDIYQPLDEDQVEEAGIQTQNVLPKACSEHVAKCPAHVRPLLEQTKPVCESEDQFSKLASLTAYQDVYSWGKDDVKQM